MLLNIAVVVKIDDVSELSYALLRQPNYTSWFVMTDHKASYMGRELELTL